MSTDCEKISAQKGAFQSEPVQRWHRHLVGPVELETMLKIPPMTLDKLLKEFSPITVYSTMTHGGLTGVRIDFIGPHDERIRQRGYNVEDAIRRCAIQMKNEFSCPTANQPSGN